MTSAQAMEEELQQSVMLSEEDEAGYGSADTGADGSTINAELDAADGGTVQVVRPGSNRHTSDKIDDEALSDQDASGEEVYEDAEGEDISMASPNGITVGGTRVGNEVDEDENEVEEEGIGAVKIKPEDSDPDEDDEDDAESEISQLASDDEDESADEAAWNEEDGADEEEEESEIGTRPLCIFCKEDEEHDPSEDFEAFLACNDCGNNAHQQCARDVAAMSARNNPKRWKCPECYSDEDDYGHEGFEAEDINIAQSGQDMRPVSQQSDIPKDLLAVHRGKVDPDGHSVFDDLVLGEDPMDGSRLLRKRKTSSIEADDSVIGLRKRRRQISEDVFSQNEDAAGSVQSRDSARGSSRRLRLKLNRPQPVTIEKRSRTALVLKMQVKPANLRQILGRKRREKRTTGVAAPRSARPSTARNNTTTDIAPIPIHAMPTPFTTDTYSQPFYSFFDRDTEEAKGKPYGGILTEGEADTSKTLPLAEDRRRFDLSKQKAEDDWRAQLLAQQAQADVPVRRPKKVSENASQIECIEFGGWEIDTWYAAPYPAEYSRNRVLYICEFCLKYMNSGYVAWRHKLKCGTKHPPGDEIYRHESISIFEVDGRKHPVYCQNLCLLAKLFLGSKTLYYDVEPFLFYVLCEYDDCGYHFVGYFSKEKRASSQNNVSCILTLPIHQRKGYGNLLIDFSYLLTKVEEKKGSPEKPLSDMGLVSYRNYWRLVLCQYLLKVMDTEGAEKCGLSISSISDETGMTPDDVVAGLEGLRALVRDPQTKLYAFRVDVDYCRQYVAKWEAKGYVKLSPDALAWTPYVMGRSNAVNFELGPPINTIAPREEEEAKVVEGAKSAGVETEPVVNGVEPDEGEQVDKAAVADEAKAMIIEETADSAEKVASDDKENAAPTDAEKDGPTDKGGNWTTRYHDIPPTRFEVFPAVTGGRRGGDRTRQSIGRRPSMPRAPSSTSRPRRPAGGSVRRPKATRPKSNGPKRKSGGTGRGPGRWPKGTKKSDYGNADSGPGLPPGWKAGQEDPALVTNGTALVEEAAVAEEEPAEDSVQVVVEEAVAKGTEVNGANGTGSDLQANGGMEMDIDEDEDVDAEGEDV